MLTHKSWIFFLPFSTAHAKQWQTINSRNPLFAFFLLPTTEKQWRSSTGANGMLPTFISSDTQPLFELNYMMLSAEWAFTRQTPRTQNVKMKMREKMSLPLKKNERKKSIKFNSSMEMVNCDENWRLLAKCVRLNLWYVETHHSLVRECWIHR